MVSKLMWMLLAMVGLSWAHDFGKFNIGAKKYLIVSDRLSWYEGRDRCKRLGGQMAKIRSLTENDILARHLPKYNALCYRSPTFLPQGNFWIGGIKLQGMYLWQTYHRGIHGHQNIGFANWNIRHVDFNDPMLTVGDFSCIHLWLDSKNLWWNDFPCNQKFCTLCESN